MPLQALFFCDLLRTLSSSSPLRCILWPTKNRTAPEKHTHLHNDAQISLELFRFVNFTSSCSLIPTKNTFSVLPLGAFWSIAQLWPTKNTFSVLPLGAFWSIAQLWPTKNTFSVLPLGAFWSIAQLWPTKNTFSVLPLGAFWSIAQLWPTKNTFSVLPLGDFGALLNCDLLRTLFQCSP